MENYNAAAEAAKNIIFNFITERRKEQGISQKKLAEIIGVSELTLIRNLKGETEMTLTTFLRLLGALKLNPYFKPKEIDDTDFKYMFFN